MKGKVLRKHNLHEKKAASVLSKLFISCNEGCPLAHERYYFPNVNNINVQSMIPGDQRNITSQ